MLALLIFLITLVLVIWQPRGLGIGWSATGGAAAALMVGVVNLHDVQVVWHIVWDATFTFVALVVISLILERAGFFAWAALHVARWGRGHAKTLLIWIVLLGAAMSALFANDGAALLLTPIVIVLLRKLGFSAQTCLVFIIATGFIADTASLPFIISNLVNIVSANYFDVSFARYATVMVPVNLVAVLASLGVLLWAFRRDLPQSLTYHDAKLATPATAIEDRLVFVWAMPILAVLLLTYFVTGQFNIPTAFVTGAAAVLFMAIAARIWQPRQRRLGLVGELLKQAPWQIVVFSVGMYVVVYGLAQAGLTDLGVHALRWLAAQTDVIAAVGTGILAAVTASIMNNMPATLVGVLSIEQAQVPAHMQELMMYANVVGNDLGPKLTPIGSLATLLWLHVLERNGFHVTWGQYMRIGVLITPPVLIITLIALALWLPWA
jgi:arsenical pump membrane protein